jgi:hypothetical protein
MPDAAAGEMPTEPNAPGEMPDPAPEMGEGSKDVEALEAALREARADAIKYRQRLRAAEEAERERAEADLSEAERAKRRADELEATLAERDATARTLALESSVAIKANSLGIVDPEAAIAMLDRDLLDFDEAGKPTSTSLDAALRRLLKQKPYLRTQPAPSSPANPSKSEPVGETPDQRRARLFGSNSGIFDASSAERMGGGVISHKE